MRGVTACMGFALSLVMAAPSGARPAVAAATGTDQEIVMELHHDHENDIGIGRLAEQRGSTPEVRSLGARLVREHGAADERLRAYATATDVDPVRIRTPYDAANHGVLKHPDLARLSGHEFDWQLAAAVVAEQQADLDRARVSAALTNDAKLKAIIVGELPMLQANLAAAEALAPTATIPPPPPQMFTFPPLQPVPEP